MSRSQIVKLQNRLFAVNLTWYECASKKEVQQILKVSKLSYGIEINNNDKITLGLFDRSMNKCQSLAGLISQHYQTGIFITDTFNQSSQETMFWVCIFENGIPVVSTSELAINGDEFYTKVQIEKLVVIYNSIKQVNIFIDSDNLAIDDAQQVLLTEIISSTKKSQFIIKKISQIDGSTKLKSAVLILLLLSLSAYFYYSESKEQAEEKLISQSQNNLPSQEVTVLKDIKANALNVILKSLENLLQNTPVVISGWKIIAINYVATNSNQVVLTYQRNEGMNIADAKYQANAYINSNNLKGSYILFFNNDERMKISMDFNKVVVPNIANLTLSQIKKNIDFHTGDLTISAIQSSYLNYRLNRTSHVNSKYSKQAVSISNIDALGFQELMNIAQKHNFLVVKSFKGNFDNNFNLRWNFLGDIYV